MNSNVMLLNDFTNYMADKWNGEFQHRFALTKRHPAWCTWHENFPDLPNSDGEWYCSNLREAFERYSWTKGKDINAFRRQLISALKVGSSEDTIDACKKIFDWGGVARKGNDPSVYWIEHQGDSLSKRIVTAVDLLKTPGADLTEFDGKQLLMNSAMTKVYWAADPGRKLAIYDGRVGAALGLLARQYLKSKGYETVPEELAFRWGSSHDKHVSGQKDKRNPSDEKLHFPRLFTTTMKDFHHAQMMRDSSFLLQQVASKLNNVSVNDLDKALFMIGYNVRESGQLTSP